MKVKCKYKKYKTSVLKLHESMNCHASCQRTFQAAVFHNVPAWSATVHALIILKKIKDRIDNLWYIQCTCMYCLLKVHVLYILWMSGLHWQISTRKGHSNYCWWQNYICLLGKFAFAYKFKLIDIDNC